MTFEKVKEIIMEHLELDDDQVTMESKLAEDLKADSLDLVEMVTIVEDSFGMEFPDEVYEKLVTVGDIVRYIDSVI